MTGKTLYRKVVDFGYLPNNTTKSLSAGLTSGFYIRKLEGVAVNPTNSSTLTIPDYSPAGGLTIRCYIRSDGYVEILTNTDRSNLYAYIILEYTKD